jgi:hypothetical protein
VARQVVERPAGRDDVDEPEEGGLELRVGAGQVHRLVVQGLERAAGGGREAGRDGPSHLQDLRLQGVHGRTVRLPAAIRARRPVAPRTVRAATLSAQAREQEPVVELRRARPSARSTSASSSARRRRR